MNISLLSDNYNDYSDLLNSIRIDSIIIKFLHSSNNRQLFFWKVFVDGSQKQLEPGLEIDLTPKLEKKGKKITLEDGEEIYEGYLFENFYRKQWNPKKWNIADTQEPAFWTFSHFINLYIKKQQTFELEFEIVAQRNSSLLK